MNRYFTIGMAGHIDHGKTTLTKALTGVDTDRLKEEKERSISIEPGFAPFIQEENLEASIIDVPGHERFIRQMISGVAGIDMFILVIAADEGMMPQTREHLDILSLLGIENGLIVITKVDRADEELLDIILEDIKEEIKQTFLEDAPIYFVDSVSMKGVSELKEALQEKLLHIEEKENNTSFRLPIDQVFTAKGQGVIVRGTVYNGEVRQGERLTLLPSNIEVRVRQIQRHHQEKAVASRGQRAALNIGGISHEKVSRGDVLVADDYYSVSDRLDVVVNVLKSIRHSIKQRRPVKLHIGTSEVMGKIIFFDRNEINSNENEEVLCQIQLEDPIVVARGDRFILRRPTPAETVGGGWVIEPNAKKHRFGKKTVEELKQKNEGTATERILSYVKERVVASEEEIMKNTAVSEKELTKAKQHLLEVEEGLFTAPSSFERVRDKIFGALAEFHKQFPMRTGLNKAEVVSDMKQQYPESLVEFALKTLAEDRQINITNQYIALTHVTPALPEKWKTRLENVNKELIQQGAEVEKWSDLLLQYKIPADIQKEFYYFLIETKKAHVFDDDRLISKRAVEQLREKLSEYTGFEDFNLQAARDSLQLSRKNLVPLLELFDQLGYTKRVGNMRSWINSQDI